MSDFKLDKRKLEKMIREEPARVDEWLRGVAQQITGDVKLSMTASPATGRTYDRGAGRTHTASSPGNPPRPDTGALINSIRVRDVARLHYEIVDGVEYGYELEVGKAGVAARPFMRPMFEVWRAKILDDASDNLILI